MEFIFCQNRNISPFCGSCIKIWRVKCNGKCLKGTSRGLEALQSHMNGSYYKSVLCWQQPTIGTQQSRHNMLRGQGGQKIQLELAIRTPGCPLKHMADASDCVLALYHLNLAYDLRSLDVNVVKRDSSSEISQKRQHGHYWTVGIPKPPGWNGDSENNDEK